MASTYIFNDDIWKTWDKSGKDQYLKLVSNAIKEEEKLSKTKIKGPTLAHCIFELMNRGVTGIVRVEKVTSTLKELFCLHNDIPSIVLDVACVLDANTSVDVQSNSRKLFSSILNELQTVLPEELMKERLEIDTLQEIGTLKTNKFYTRFIKIKTKLYYKQKKFNLFREESEGYSKLIVELNQDFDDNIEWRNLLEIIQSLIGCFNLDPNRVLDIILESFEARPYLHFIFIPLIKNYMNDAQVISEVLGFKLDIVETEEDDEPSKIIMIIALLLQHDVIKLQNIYPWLKPDDVAMIKSRENDLKAAHEFLRKLNIISTKTPNPAAEIQEEKYDFEEHYAGNQKLVLGTALLKVGCLKVFQELVGLLPEGIALISRKPALALCKILHALVEPIYREKCKISPKIKGKLIAPLDSPLAPPSCTTFEELKTDVIPALVMLGASVHYDPILMYKLIRLLKSAHALPVNPLKYEALSLLDVCILPALTHMDGNCCLAEEIFTLIKSFPYQHRYSLYGRWKNESWEKSPSLVRTKGYALQKIKAIMKRVSKENIKPQGRLIGKLSHAAPIFIFDYILLQIQSYDNLIGPVVDSLKYLTSLSYDVLGYCLLESLATGRASISPNWLTALAQFAGAAFKKYIIDLTPLMQYVANQLKAQRSQDLIILKEIVQKMAGIEAAEEMTNEQLDAMAGGELLKGEAGYFQQVRNTRRSSLRLKEAVTDNFLDIALCILSAQQKYCCVWKEMEEEDGSTNIVHLKLVGRLVDQCQDALVQLGTFVASSHTKEEYAARLPPIQELLQEYHVGVEVAFFLYRPIMSRTDCSEVLVNSIMPMLPNKVWEDISPDFYVTFWSLTMYDLQVPEESYDKEIEKLKSQIAASIRDNSNSKGKKEQERFNTLIEKLQEERRRQRVHVESVRSSLSNSCANWFPARAVRSAKNETITRLMLLCVFPRVLAAPTDARYAATFLHTLHALRTPNFSTLLCYDRLFCDIAYSLISCTEAEANRYGEFLCRVLGTAMKWHKERSAFQKECADYPGFVTKYRVSNQFTESNDHVGYENYRHVCHKWHYKITKAMVICLDSSDYVQIRNAIIVLIRILPHFPVLAKLSQIIERKIEKVREEEKGRRQDLFVLATGYSGQLRSRASEMMGESEFHQIVEKTKHPTGNDITTIQTNNSSDIEEIKEKPTDRKSRDTTAVSDKKETSSHRDTERNRDDWSKERSSRDRVLREEYHSEPSSPPPPEVYERDLKRRKTEAIIVKNKDEERIMEKEKKKASKLRSSEESRKERKITRKRERIEEPLVAEQKRRREDQKVIKISTHQNGEEYVSEKYSKRDKSPPYRDRSHERQESRESKQLEEVMRAS